MAQMQLTPEVMSMVRTQMVFPDRMIRIFNGRGAISVRDRSVTGLQGIQFPPAEIPGYQFQLAFFERSLNGFIQDLQADVYEHWRDFGDNAGPHPLGLNCFSDRLPKKVGFDMKTPLATPPPMVILLQKAEWQPNRYYRVGTFHKCIENKWVSFGIETVVTTSHLTDEVFLSVTVENRGIETIRFIIVPDQRVISSPSSGLQQEDESRHLTPLAIQWQNTLISVVSDLRLGQDRGFRWDIGPHAKQSAIFAIQVKNVSESSSYPTNNKPIAVRLIASEQSTRQQLFWAEEALPKITTPNAALNTFYRRCIVTVLQCRWTRENFVCNPFYAVGSWLSTLAWDTSFASEMLSILDPDGLKTAFKEYLAMGLQSSWLHWSGKKFGWYVQSPFALMRILVDLMHQSGNMELLDDIVNGTTVLNWMKRFGIVLHQRFARSDGLLDFGGKSQAVLEIRTDGYQHVVAATNALAGKYYAQLAQWSHIRCDADDSKFHQWATRIRDEMNRQLWDESEGWFDNLFPDGQRHRVWSYHLFDILDSPLLFEHQRQRLIEHLKPGIFLGPFGIYSISPQDTIHYDQEDADWGGGGQYVGMTLRLVEVLYRLGHCNLAWDILTRCLKWNDAFPYFPQEVFTDFLGTPVVEMPLEIAAGSGVQAVLHGLFGLRPDEFGVLTIDPAPIAEVLPASLMGYRYRGHSFDVELELSNFVVSCDGHSVARNRYGCPIRVGPQR